MNKYKSATDGVRTQCERCQTLYLGDECPNCAIKNRPVPKRHEVKNEYAERQKAQTLRMGRSIL